MLIAFGAPVASAINVVILKKRGHGVDLVPAVFLGGIISAALMLPLALPSIATAGDIALLALLGFAQLGLPCMLLVIAARHLAATEVALLALLEVVLGPLWAWLGAGEVPGDHDDRRRRAGARRAADQRTGGEDGDAGGYLAGGGAIVSRPCCRVIGIRGQRTRPTPSSRLPYDASGAERPAECVLQVHRHGGSAARRRARTSTLRTHSNSFLRRPRSTGTGPVASESGAARTPAAISAMVPAATAIFAACI